MSTARPKIAIYHEHPDWFRPLFAELDRRGIPYLRLDAPRAVLLRSGGPRAAVPRVLQPDEPFRLPAQRRAAPSSTRLISSRTSNGSARGVVNGHQAFDYEVSKALQLTLLAELGVAAPRSRVIHRGSDAPAAARGLRFPVIVKANVGGSGGRHHTV